MDDWQKAGEIAAKAREYSKELVKEGVLALEIAEKIEDKIVELGGKPAFPVSIAINHVAAHYAPQIGDMTKIAKGDLVKVDLGCHINGCIADTSITIEVNSNKNKDLIKAAEAALDEAVKYATPGRKIGEIGRAIHDVISSYGFSSVKNLSGHGLSEYIVHHGITIPNYDNNDSKKLEEGMKIAIEPFATDGKGLVIESKQSGIYSIDNIRPTRNFEARKLLMKIHEDYMTLPFSVRWLDFKNVNFLIRLLERDGILRSHPVLVEESHGLVSQAEHTGL